MKEKNTVTEKHEEAFNFQKDNLSIRYLINEITGIKVNMKDSLKIAIAGATGYVGLELVKILSLHPRVKIIYLLANKSAGKSIYLFDKKIKKKNLPKIRKISDMKMSNVDVIFSALPNGEAHKIAKKLNNDNRLIDLSADFRIANPKIYEKWYGKKHLSKNLINKSLYSLTEFVRKKIKEHKIISCPGCYPTSIQLPLIPLIKSKLIKTNTILIDSKSGYSGAGKNIKKKFHFKKLLDSVSSYGIGSHRHMPEIDQELMKAAKRKVNVTFTPHLIPMFRGILSTIYLDVKKKYSAKYIYSYLKKYHKNNSFIKFAKFNSPIGTGDVVDTNFCKISVCKNRMKDKIIIISVIDNLLKGAAGQAVQNMNAAYGFNENLGLK